MEIGNFSFRKKVKMSENTVETTREMDDDDVEEYNTLKYQSLYVPNQIRSETNNIECLILCKESYPVSVFF